MINEKNIEAFLLDYAEGILSDELTIELFAFLAKHPEWDLFEELPKFEFESPRFGGFDSLKKKNYFIPKSLRIEGEHPEDLMAVAAIENLLSPQELRKMEDLIGISPNYKKTLSDYQSTIFESDNSIEFKFKSRLKRRSNLKLVTWFSGVSVAASITLFLWLKTERVNSYKVAHNRNHYSLNESRFIQAKSKKSTEQKLSNTFEREILETDTTLLLSSNEFNTDEKIEFVTAIDVFDDLGEVEKRKNELKEPTKYNNVQDKMASDLVQNSELSAREFIVNKTNEFLFGNSSPTLDQKYDVLSKTVSAAVGRDFEIRKANKTNQRYFFFRFGFFSIERKITV
jgi:hypothetical protein